MDEHILIEPEAWQEFEEIIEHHLNEGEFYYERDMRVFCDRHDWHHILQSEDKLEFRRRIRVLRGHVAKRAMWEHRRKQINGDGIQFWVYGTDSCCPFPEHHDMDGLTLPPHHPFWQRYIPPNGWRCFCRVRIALSPNGAKRVGGDPDKPLPDWWNRIDPDTELPPGIEPLFDGDTFPTLMEFFETVVNETDYRWIPDIK